MPRGEIPFIVIKPSASVSGLQGSETVNIAVAGASVLINIRGGGPATIYSAETGTGTIANPTVSTSEGRIDGWLDEGSYSMTVSGSGISTYSQPFEIVRGDGVSRIADGAVTSAAIASAIKDPVAGTAGLRTLGTGAQQAAPGNHNHDSRYQPLDDDLTSIAAVSTTNLGRGLLAAPNTSSLRAQIGLNVTGGSLNYNSTGLTEIGLGYPVPQTKVVIDCKSQRPVLLMARGYYRNNTGATQTPTWTFARRPGGDPGNVGTGWTRIGHGGGGQSIASGATGGGSGPLLPLESFYVDIPPVGDTQYTYALWFENGADNPGFGSSTVPFYTWVEASYSVVQL